MQEGMLFHSLCQQAPGSYLEQLVCDLDEELDAQDFKKSWQQVLNRHSVLRTRFNWSNTKILSQFVELNVKLPFEEYDFRSLPKSEQINCFDAFLQSDRQRGFDLSKAPLMRLALFRIAESNFKLVWTFHHALLDGRSILIVLKEVFALYEASKQGKPLMLDPSYPYEEYVNWLQQQPILGSEAFWRKKLSGFREPVILSSLDSGKSDDPQHACHRTQSMCLSAESATALKTFAREYNLTLNTLFQGAWSLLLSRYSGKNDVIFGATRACRYTALPEMQSRVGIFINTLPMRVQTDPDAPLIPWLQSLRSLWIDYREHELTPLAKIQEWSDLPEGTPLFESLLVFENTSLSAALKEQGGAWEKREFELFEQPHFPLSLAVTGGHELLLKVFYNSHNFGDQFISRMLGHVKVLLEQFVDHPQQSLGRVSMLSSDEQDLMLRQWNATESNYPSDICIHELFESQVRCNPDNIAIIFGERELTYKELDQQANQLANYLRDLDVKAGVFVGIAVERSVEMIVGLLGILKSGGAYVPLDPSYPKERLSYMLQDAKPAVLLTTEDLLRQLPEYPSTVVCLDRDWNAISQASQAVVDTCVHPHDLAYVIYTSGSTGKSKGVAVPHQAINRLVCNTNYIKIQSTDRIAQASNASFDAATFEIWGALINGAQLIGLSKNVLLSPYQFATYIQERKISILFLTTALFNLLASTVPQAFCSLRYLLFGGEAADPKWVREVLNYGSPQYLLNVYGPTENTTFSSWYLVKDIPQEILTVPIGTPISNTQLYILDQNQQPVPIGIPGELYIGGDGLAQGYLNRPELTAEKFVKNPFGEDPDSKLYKTGDLARYLSDGNIEFIGRIDNQIKIRGFRIELGEVETFLGLHPAVGKSIVLLQDAAGGKQLAAYIVPHKGQQANLNDMRRFLQQKLPEYMVPSFFIVLEELPLTHNGKVDRRALPQLDSSCQNVRSDIVLPRDDLERQLCGVWERVLEISPIGMNDNFFELGVHSILVLRLLSEIENVFNQKVPVAALFQAPTIRELAQLFRSEGWTTSWHSLIPIQSGTSELPLFSIHGLYLDLIKHLGPEQTIYGLHYGLNSHAQHFQQVLPESIEEFAAHYLEELRSIQPQGPYLLMGHSAGGLIAYEMAQQLIRKGHQVALLAMLDTTHPRRLREPEPLLPVHQQILNLLKVGLSGVLYRLKFRIYSMLSEKFNIGNTTENDLKDKLNHQLYPQIRSYEPQSYPGEIVFFKARDITSIRHETISRELDWLDLVQSKMEVYEIPGSHDGMASMLKNPNVQLIADILKKYLKISIQASQPVLNVMDDWGMQDQSDIFFHSEMNKRGDC